MYSLAVIKMLNIKNALQITFETVSEKQYINGPKVQIAIL
jgi:hypothetical protein